MSFTVVSMVKACMVMKMWSMRGQTIRMAAMRRVMRNVLPARREDSVDCSRMSRSGTSRFHVRSAVFVSSELCR